MIFKKKTEMIDIQSIVSQKDRDKLEVKEQPNWVSPMLATLTHEEFSDENWIYERKLDGERCLVFKNGHDLRLMSRNKKKLNCRYPEIEEALASDDSDPFIVDGEIVAFDGNVTSFSMLQNRMQLIHEEDVKKSDVTVYYYVFDILYAGIYNLSNLPLRERKKILRKRLKFEDPIRYTPHRNEEGIAYLKEACRKGWEGLIAKKADAEYVHTRSKKWLKFKCINRQEFIIIGYTEPKGNRIGFGALLLGYYDNDALLYAGKVGTGFNDDFLSEMSQKLKSFEIDHSPLDNGNILNDSIHWVRPKFVAEIRFTEWTKEGRLRHPSFQGLRDDKIPKEVVKEG
jgi:bifunctional non-homologous end joining protein LigD